MRYSLIAIIAFCLSSLSSQAQNELHFTQFEMAPLALNPGLAGDFRGTFRIGGIYRDQWNFMNADGSSFKTLDFFVDVNAIRGFRKQDWVSVGLGYNALDQGGAGNLKNNYSRINAAYHLSLDKKQNSILTLGVQRMSRNSSINKVEAQHVKIDGVDRQEFNNSAGENGIEGDYSDWVLGLTFNQRNATSDLMIGVKAGRMISTEFALGNANSELDPLISAFANYTFAINDVMRISPSLLYQSNGPAAELVVQGRVGYALNKDLAINGGLGMRMGDALLFLVGADYKQYQIGVSYDFTISDLTNAGGGAFELALNYTGIIRKKPKVKPIIICPRL